MIAATLSAALALAGALIPSRLGPLERAWMELAHAISKVTTPIFLAIVYFLVLTPAGLIRRNLGKNPLIRTAQNGSFWIERDRTTADERRRRLERQF